MNWVSIFHSRRELFVSETYSYTILLAYGLVLWCMLAFPGMENAIQTWLIRKIAYQSVELEEEKPDVLISVYVLFRYFMKNIVLHLV